MDLLERFHYSRHIFYVDNVSIEKRIPNKYGIFNAWPIHEISGLNGMTVDHVIEFELNGLYERGFFSRLDFYFAKFLSESYAEKDPVVIASCALVSRMVGMGHVCIDLTHYAGELQQVSETDSTTFLYPEKKLWLSALNDSQMVSFKNVTPLVLDASNRLYMARYYDFQTRLVENLSIRVTPVKKTVDNALIDSLIDPMFAGNLKGIEQQKTAVKHSVTQPFTIISGGPGTGKTYVTKAIRTLCQKIAVATRCDEPVILCAAPTGKAASKMENGRTIHAVLKPYQYKAGFHYNKDNPLQADVVIIDEASMIDMVLLTRLLEAVPLSAKIILIGDSHQLASVQAGSVFSDICRTEEMASCIHQLTYNFRSRGKSGIEALANAINGNDPDRVAYLLESGKFSDIIFESTAGNNVFKDRLRRHVLQGYRPLLQANTEESLCFLDGFRVLSAHNLGEYGTLQINHVCEKILRSQGNFDIHDRLFKTVIMVNVNDYHKKLFNGDTGIAAVIDGEHMVLFPSETGKKRQFRFTDVPGHDNAFCITVHKAQGSEFDTVLLVIPEHMSPVLTRQLLYTGVTRARNKVIVLGDMEVIRKTVCQSTKRSSGIAPLLAAALKRNKDFSTDDPKSIKLKEVKSNCMDHDVKDSNGSHDIWD